MKFTVNYSVPLEKLILSGTIKPDAIKCPEWPNLIQLGMRAGPVYTHNEIALGTGRTSKLNFELILQGLLRTKTPHLNCHLIGNKDYLGDPARK